MRYLFALFVFACCSLLQAKNTVTQWQFHLATDDGKHFINSQKINQPILVNFWGAECPPCVKELPLLQQFAEQHPHWQVILINVDQDRQKAKQFLKQHQIRLTNLKITTDAMAFMRNAGNHIGALPYTLVLTSGKSKQVCTTHLGALNETHLQRWLTDCQ